MPSVVVESVLLDCLFSVWCFVDRSLSFCLLAIALSLLIRITDSDWHFDIFKLF